MHHTTDRIEHTTAFGTPVVEHWLEREIAQWVRPMKDRSDDPSHHERTLLPRSYISLHRRRKLRATGEWVVTNYSLQRHVIRQSSFRVRKGPVPLPPLPLDASALFTSLPFDDNFSHVE